MILDGMFVNLGEPTKVLYEVSMSISEQSNQAEDTKIKSSAVGYTDSTLSRGKLCTWGSGVRCNDDVGIISPTTQGGRR